MPATPTIYHLGAEPAFRLALKLIAAMHGVTASTDVPVLDHGGVNDGILRDILNGLARDACDWVSVLYHHSYNLQFSSSIIITASMLSEPRDQSV